MILISMTSLVCILLNIHHELLVEAKIHSVFGFNTSSSTDFVSGACAFRHRQEPDWQYWRSQADLLILARHNTCLTEAFALALWGHRGAANFSYTSPQCFIYQSGCVLLWNTVKAKGKVNMIGSSKCYFRPAMSSASLAQTVCGKYFWVCMNPHRNKHIPAFQEKFVKLIFTFTCHCLNFTGSETYGQHHNNNNEACGEMHILMFTSILAIAKSIVSLL